MSNEIGFALKPRNLDEAVKMAEMLTKSAMVPKMYQHKPQDALVAMIMGAELGLNPVQAMQNIAVINGRPSIYGDALAALAQNHPKFGGMTESFDDATMTATCIVWRKGAEKFTQRFSQKDAQQAGLWGKTGPWSCYPKRMLAMRARGFALRSQFADALSGLITREEAEDMPDDAQPLIDVTPEPEFYPDDKFDQNFPKWEKMIESGKTSAEHIVSMVSAKANLTDKQKSEILKLGNENADM